MTSDKSYDALVLIGGCGRLAPAPHHDSLFLNLIRIEPTKKFKPVRPPIKPHPGTSRKDTPWPRQRVLPRVLQWTQRRRRARPRSAEKRPTSWSIVSRSGPAWPV